MLSNICSTYKTHTISSPAVQVLRAGPDPINQGSKIPSILLWVTSKTNQRNFLSLIVTLRENRIVVSRGWDFSSMCFSIFCLSTWVNNPAFQLIQRLDCRVFPIPSFFSHPLPHWGVLWVPLLDPQQTWVDYSYLLSPRGVTCLL